MIYTIQNDRFTLSVSDKGAIVTNLILDGKQITKSVETMTQFEKGGLFSCPQIFGRLLGRELWFRGKSYKLHYPKQFDSETLDPSNIFIHGFEHFLTWDLVQQTENSLHFELPKERFEENFPFPHTSFIKYDLSELGLNISVGIKDCEIDTPAALVFHPFFNWTIDGQTPSLKANLDRKFKVPEESEFPMPWSAPVSANSIFNENEFVLLSKDLDQSFLSSNGIYDIKWGSDFGIRIQDTTKKTTSSIYPVQVWTTGADSRGLFGVEPGGLANIFWLASQNVIPEEWLPICQKGKSISRDMLISVLSF